MKPPKREIFLPIFSLLSGVAMLVVGMSLLFSAIGVRSGDAQFTPLITGLINSAYFAGFVVGTFACPVIIRQVGHIRAFAAMASLLSTLPILHLLWQNPMYWGLLRLMTGVCLVGLYIVVESWLNVVAHTSIRGKVFAAYMATCGIASAIGQWMILVGDQRSFLPFALVSILFSLALLPLTLTPVEEPEAVEAPAFSFKELFHVSPVGVTAATYSGLLTSAFYSLGTVFGQGVGFSASGIATFMAATILGGAVFQWPIGHFSDRHDRCWVLLWVCVLGAGLAALGFYFAREYESYLIFLGVVLGGLMFAIYGLAVAHVNDLIDPAKTLEVTGGLLLLYGIGATAGPILAGFVMELSGDEGLMLYLGLGLALLALSTWFFIITRQPHQQPGTEHKGYVLMESGSSQAALKLDPRIKTIRD
jgi:MFS family permease